MLRAETREIQSPIFNKRPQLGMPETFVHNSQGKIGKQITNFQPTETAEVSPFCLKFLQQVETEGSGAGAHFDDVKRVFKIEARLVILQERQNQVGIHFRYEGIAGEIGRNPIPGGKAAGGVKIFQHGPDSTFREALLFVKNCVGLRSSRSFSRPARHAAVILSASVFLRKFALIFDSEPH